MSFTIDFTGKSGAAYKYWSLDNPTADGIIAAAGNYAFVQQLQNGNFMPLYFGVAEDLKARVPGHERWDEAIKLGATHIMAHTTPAGEEARLAEERDLIQYWNPPLNTHHRQVG
jgi:hypothetical protein